MAFEGLTEKLQQTFKKLKGKGKLSEKDVKDGMREVKLALLEADVNFIVVKDFIKRISQRAVDLHAKPLPPIYGTVKGLYCLATVEPYPL